MYVRQYLTFELAVEIFGYVCVALVRAYSDFVIRGLGLQEFAHYAQPEPNRTIVITYMARRGNLEFM